MSEFVSNGKRFTLCETQRLSQRLLNILLYPSHYVFLTLFLTVFFQELLEQLHLQQDLADQQQQIRQTAQHLINEAWQQHEETARTQRELDGQQASRLLDEAFPLADAAASNPHGRSNGVVSPPPQSSESLPNSASQRGAEQSSRSSKSRPKTALERLLSDGSLTIGLPPTPRSAQSSRRQSANGALNNGIAGSHSGKNAWESQPTLPRRGRTNSSGGSSIRSAAEVISQGLNSLTPHDKQILLQAIRDELQSMEPTSQA